MLFRSIHPFSQIKEWQQSVHKIAELKPDHVIPGHGKAASWNKVQRETVDYLDYLVNGVSVALKEWLEMDETIKQMAEAPKFKHLINFESWHRRNIHRTYLQFEMAQ